MIKESLSNRNRFCQFTKKRHTTIKFFYEKHPVICAQFAKNSVANRTCAHNTFKNLTCIKKLIHKKIETAYCFTYGQNTNRIHKGETK